MAGQRQSRGGGAPYPQDQRDRGGRPRGDYYPDDPDLGMPDPRPQRDPRRGGYDDRPPRGGYDDRRYDPRDPRGYDRGYDPRDPRGPRDYDDRGYDREPQPKQSKGGGGKAFAKFIGVLLLIVIAVAGGTFLGLMLGGKGIIFNDGILGKFGLARQSSMPDPALVASDEKELVSYWEETEEIDGLSEKLADGTVKDLLEGKKSSAKGESSATSDSSGTGTDASANGASTTETTGTTTADGTQQPAANNGVAQATQVDPGTGQPVAPAPEPQPAAEPAPAPVPAQPAPAEGQPAA